MSAHELSAAEPTEQTSLALSDDSWGPRPAPGFSEADSAIIAAAVKHYGEPVQTTPVGWRVQLVGFLDQLRMAARLFLLFHAAVLFVVVAYANLPIWLALPLVLAGCYMVPVLRRRRARVS